MTLGLLQIVRQTVSLLQSADILWMTVNPGGAADSWRLPPHSSSFTFFPPRNETFIIHTPPADMPPPRSGCPLNSSTDFDAACSKSIRPLLKRVPVNQRVTLRFRADATSCSEVLSLPKELATVPLERVPSVEIAVRIPAWLRASGSQMAGGGS
jgi:hypothetical protein